jgi:hypothetical protein
MKLLFIPFSLIASRLAGLTGKKVTDRLWSLVDDRRPPKPDEPGVGWGRLAGALLIEGAVFRLLAGIADHAARRWFERLTGRWPGERHESEQAEQQPGDPQHAG